MGVEKGIGRRGFLGGFAGLTSWLSVNPPGSVMARTSSPLLEIPLPLNEAAQNLRISAMGIGGAGCRALAALEQSGGIDAKFIYANTDRTALRGYAGTNKLQLGESRISALGAPTNPEIGRHSAEESADEIRRHLEGSHIAFLVAGMGGGTGTGSTPVVARLAKGMGILTIAVAVTPFDFEGDYRMTLARHGIKHAYPVITHEN